MIYHDYFVRLKKTMKEREAYLQKQLERQKRRGSMDSAAGAEKEVLKMRLKKRRRNSRKMNRVIPKS